jgi:hypothetical protein
MITQKYKIIITARFCFVHFAYGPEKEKKQRVRARERERKNRE